MKRRVIQSLAGLILWSRAGRFAFVFVALLLPIFPLAAHATTVLEANGFRFSDEQGGFILRSVSGAGSKNDPFIIHQDYYGPGPAVLTIAPGAQSDPSFLYVAMICVIRNMGPRPWIGFDFELQENYLSPSDYWDGLSFDQIGANREGVFISDRFALGDRITEPFDRVRFHQGGVNQGVDAQFQFFITDPTPPDTFYLLQEPVLLLVRNDVEKDGQGTGMQEARTQLALKPLRPVTSGFSVR